MFGPSVPLELAHTDRMDSRPLDTRKSMARGLFQGHKAVVGMPFLFLEPCSEGLMLRETGTRVVAELEKRV